MALNDTLTNTNGTLLTAHTGDSGHTWADSTFADGQFEFNGSNQVYCTTAGIAVNDWTPTNANYAVTATYYRHTNLGSMAIGVRLDEATGNGYVAYQKHASEEWALSRIDANDNTELGTYTEALSNGTSVELVLSCVGDTISLSIGGTERISVTDATYSAAGQVGIRSLGTQSGSQGKMIAAISAEDVVVNTAPTVDAGADATITAGDTLTRTVSFTDPDADTWSATADYGEGAGPVAATVDQGNKTVALSNLYETAGNYTVTVVVSDGTTTGQDTFIVTVNEVGGVIIPNNAYRAAILHAGGWI